MESRIEKIYEIGSNIADRIYTIWKVMMVAMKMEFMKFYLIQATRKVKSNKTHNGGKDE
jgi:hypothetical protein